MNALRQNSTLRILVIVLMVPLTGSAIDIYVPSLPAITHFFNVPISTVQLTVPIYLLGYSFAQLFCGALADALGRKPVLITGIIIYALASFAATLSPNITTLIIIRLIQGMAVAAPGVLSRAIAIDSFDKEKLPAVINYITIAWAMGPILAPVIGGYLQSYFNWHAPFYFLALFAILNLLMVVFLLPETLKNRHSLHYKVLFENYKRIMSSKLFIVVSLMAAVFYSNLILFNIDGPFLIQSVLHHSPIVYGHMALILGVVWFSGSLTNRLLIKRLAFNTLLTGALSLVLTAAVIMIVLALAQQLNLGILIIPTAFILFASAIAFTNCFGKSLGIFPQIAGTASSMMGSLFVGGTAVTMIIASQLKTHSLLPLALAYTVLALIAVVLFMISRRAKQ